MVGVVAVEPTNNSWQFKFSEHKTCGENCISTMMAMMHACMGDSNIWGG